MVNKIKLSKEDIERLKALDVDIEACRAELERAKRVGIDVSQLEKQLEEAIKLRDNILKEYGSE